VLVNVGSGFVGIPLKFHAAVMIAKDIHSLPNL
jgi:hypothetical protein